MRRITFIAGVATGYVLGARAGRGHYEKIKSVALKVSHSQAAHTAMDKAGDTGGKLLNTAMDKAPGWVPGSHSPDAAETYVNGRSSTSMRP
ncbi:MAG TPA: hypothetical protein VGL04_03630 [Sporichthyaceae bacterium]|jgi:hypothetical protein